MDYYSQTEHPDNNPHAQSSRANGFAIASMICGIISVIACCTGVLAVPFGALGILFALFVKRKSQPLPGMCTAGIWLSCVGIALGILMTIYSFVMIFQNPALLQELNATFEAMYGMNMEEYFQYVISQYAGGAK